MMQGFKCPKCGKSYDMDTSCIMKDNTGKSCCQICYKKEKIDKKVRLMDKKKCLYCGKDINKIYCNDNCKQKYYYLTKPHIKINANKRHKKYYAEGRTKIYSHNCINCGKLYKSDKIKNKYCSLDCVFKHRRKISKNILITKQMVLERANGYCEKCGQACIKFHVHHKEDAKYYRNGHSPIIGNQNLPKNLIALCIFCHRREHFKGIRRFTEKGICLGCGKEFKYYPKANRGKYCSRKCFYSNAKANDKFIIPVKCKCVNCGLEFMSLRSNKYCSKKCKSQWYYNAKRTKK